MQNPVGVQRTGTRDDTRTLQGMINASAGGTLLLPPNTTYVATSTIYIPSNTTIKGSGPTTILKFTWARSDESHGGAYITNARTGEAGGTRHIRLENLSIIGSGSGKPAGPSYMYPMGLPPAVLISRAHGFSISHLTIKNAPGMSIHYQGSQDGVIVGNHIVNSGRDGITGTWDGQNIINVMVANNTIKDIGDDGIAVVGLPLIQPPYNSSALPSHIIITNNQIAGWNSNVNGMALGRGIALVGVTDSEVVRNTIVRTFGSGILIAGCSQFDCPSGQENISTRNPTGTADVDPSTGSPWLSSGLMISDNMITDAGSLSRGSALRGVQINAGISIESTQRSTISGNSIAKSYGLPIRNEGCSGCIIY